MRDSVVERDQSGAAARLGVTFASERRAAGLTQRQLADGAAVSVGAVRDLEQGRTARPRWDTAKALALVLGLNLDQVADAAGWPVGDGHVSALAQGAEPMAAGLWLGVLGPLGVWQDGVPADAGAGRQRAVLGLLALHPGTALHRETIIDVVWGHQAPASAVPMVQSYASRLRRLLGEQVVTSDGASYRLALTADELDTLEFARLADRAWDAAGAGSPAAACGLYERAVRLWRGTPLADVAAMRGHPAVAELWQRRTAVILGYAAAAVAAGWPERSLPLLRDLTTRDPLNEHAHARLMLTLAACGQQAAALAVFDQLRQQLDEELGLTPGAELGEAHQRVLRGQFPRAPAQGSPPEDSVQAPGHELGPAAPAPGQPAPVPRQLPPSVMQFTGRASELAALTGQLDQAVGRAGTVVISAIGGMAGVGKTTLAVYWAHQVAARFPDGQLYVNLRGFGSSRGPATPAEAIRGFLDALGVPATRIPQDLDSQVGLYRGLLADRRLLIVLDNARDEQQVRPLLPASPGCLVVVTSRSQLAGLAAAEGASLLTLDVLTDAEASEMLAARLGPERADIHAAGRPLPSHNHGNPGQSP